MTNKWIEAQRKQLVQEYQRCKKAEEPVLEAFSVYLLRILTGLSQMESSKLYGYEAQILGGVMELFCIHYIEQVDSALVSEINPEEKRTIIGDIEDAISKISNVYKNVIDSTSNSDRQMLTSQAVETSIYDISPKMFVTYSIILETLVRLFDEQNEYAFLLHPSLKSSIETTSLFNRREKKGKVVLIYIPENEIEKISQIPIYLLHEAFHVLTRKERNRQARACNMGIHMLNAISQRLFKNVDLDFTGSQDIKEGIQKELSKRWFKVRERNLQLKKLAEDDRRFYSKNFEEQICEEWRTWLSNIFVTLADDLCQVLAGIGDKLEESVLCEKLPQLEWQIQRNLVEILAGNRVTQYAVMYMAIYREAYADVACILATGISPVEYEQAFKDSEIMIADDRLKQSIARSLRIHSVAKTVSTCKGINHAQDWKEYSQRRDFRRCDTLYNAENIAGNEGQNESIEILEEDLKLFEKNIGKCGKDLWRILGQEDSAFGQFRSIMGEMSLLEILNGSVNEKLQELSR